MINMLLVQQPSEKKAADILLRYYFVKLPSDRERGSGLGMPPYLMTADWWTGLQRVQPGSASGTQAQESWHKHKLNAYLELRSCSGTCAGIVVVVVLGEVREADFHLNDKFTKGGRKTKAGGTFQWRVFLRPGLVRMVCGPHMGNFLTIPFG